MEILVTGGSGFIGRHLIQNLVDDGHRVHVLTRSIRRSAVVLPTNVFLYERLSNLNVKLDAVVNLAGEPLFGEKWDETKKNNLIESRVLMTRKLIQYFHRSKNIPEVLINGSAIGYYGRNDWHELTEESSPNPEFTHKLCRKWEHTAIQAERLGIRVCIIRIGIVLERDGGALQQMLPVFKWGLGGILGTGEQVMSWIHMYDLVRIIRYLIDNQNLSGVFNATAPHPVKHREFAKTLAGVIYRPCLMPVPDFMLRLRYGEMADLLLTGQRVIPKNLLQSGFDFKYSELEQALTAIFSRRANRV